MSRAEGQRAKRRAHGAKRDRKMKEKFGVGRSEFGERQGLLKKVSSDECRVARAEIG